MCPRMVCSSCPALIETTHLCIQNDEHGIDLCLCPDCFDRVLESALDRLGIYGSEARAIGSRQVLEYVRALPHNRFDVPTAVQ